MMLKILEDPEMSPKILEETIEKFTSNDWFSLEENIGKTWRKDISFTKQELAELEIWCFENSVKKGETFEEWGIIYEWSKNIERALAMQYAYTLPREKKEAFSILKEKAYATALALASDAPIKYLKQITKNLREDEPLGKALEEKLQEKKKYLSQNNLCELCEQIVTPDNDARIFHVILANINKVDKINSGEDLKLFPEYSELIAEAPRHIMPQQTGNFWMGVICPGSPARQYSIINDEDWKKAYAKQQELFKK
ncbi:MAG: hypothetical protein V1891_04570 [bacterium]